MNRRGRPRHPDILTPREWEVLGHLRRDLTNEQIADHLSISLDGAKYHVSQILSKLNVSSREDAAAWSPEDDTGDRVGVPRLRRWALAPLALKIAGGAVASVAIAGTAALALGVMLNDGDEPVADSSAAELPPLIGVDHWHAEYHIWICGELQPILPAFGSSGIEPVNGTHADGILTTGDAFIHMKPGRSEEEGDGASLSKFFEYGSGELTDDTIQLPGSETAYHSGDSCPDGEDANAGVWVNGVQIGSVTGYIPQDGDRIVISFGVSPPPSDPPLIGDHWHAKYDIWICGEHQTPFAPFSSTGIDPIPGIHPKGIHTTGDGYIHLEPATLDEQGDGASLSRFFNYAGGDLSETLLQMPGANDFYLTGYTCPDGEPSSLKIWVKSGRPGSEFVLLQTSEFRTYVPQDADQIVISFGPVGETQPLDTPPPLP